MFIYAGEAERRTMTSCRGTVPSFHRRHTGRQAPESGVPVGRWALESAAVSRLCPPPLHGWRAAQSVRPGLAANGCSSSPADVIKPGRFLEWSAGRPAAAAGPRSDAVRLGSAGASRPTFDSLLARMTHSTTFPPQWHVHHTVKH